MERRKTLRAVFDSGSDFLILVSPMHRNSG
jgi:hypothetical protein